MFYFEKKINRPKILLIILTLALVIDTFISIVTGFIYFQKGPYFDIYIYTVRASVGAILHPIFCLFAIFSLRNNNNVGIGVYLIMMFWFFMASASLMIGMEGAALNPPEVLFSLLEYLIMFLLSLLYLIGSYKLRLPGVS